MKVEKEEKLGEGNLKGHALVVAEGMLGFNNRISCFRRGNCPRWNRAWGVQGKGGKLLI